MFKKTLTAADDTLLLPMLSEDGYHAISIQTGHTGQAAGGVVQLEIKNGDANDDTAWTAVTLNDPTANPPAYAATLTGADKYGDLFVRCAKQARVRRTDGGAGNLDVYVGLRRLV